jgi:hypothetical protein
MMHGQQNTRIFSNQVIKEELEERMKVTGRKGIRRKQILEEKNRMLEIETVNTRLRSAENSLRKRLWTCRVTEYRMNVLFLACLF